MAFFFIIAFGMAFYVIRSEDEGFTTIHNSLLTTFVMMNGELDYRDTFLLNGPNEFYTHIQRIFLVVFLIVVTIAIMNLLTGLAVGDISAMLKRSKVEKLRYKV
jgi:hypothetical protein